MSVFSPSIIYIYFDARSSPVLFKAKHCDWYNWGLFKQRLGQKKETSKKHETETDSLKIFIKCNRFYTGTNYSKGLMSPPPVKIPPPPRNFPSPEMKFREKGRCTQLFRTTEIFLDASIIAQPLNYTTNIFWYFFKSTFV